MSRMCSKIRLTHIMNRTVLPLLGEGHLKMIKYSMYYVLCMYYDDVLWFNSPKSCRINVGLSGTDAYLMLSRCVTYS